MSQSSECDKDCQLEPQGVGMYPTSYAAEDGHFQTLKLLLDYGVPLNDYTVEITAMHGHYACLQLLLEHNAPISKNAITRATLNGHYECVELIRAYQSE